MKRFRSGSAVAAAVLALAVAGCGGSSKKSTTSNKSASTPAATSTTSSGTTSTSTTGGKPLSKKAYEARLGPLLNGRVVPALEGAMANGGARNPKNLQTAVNALNEAHRAMASINPPAKIADVNQQAVVALAALSTDLSKMRGALLAKDKGAYLSAARSTAQEALKMQNIGNELTARGF